MKEEVDYDPSKTEDLEVKLNINDQKDNNGEPLWIISRHTPWIIEDIEDKIQTSLGIGHLNSLFIDFLDCKSCVANEFLDLLFC